MKKYLFILISPVLFQFSYAQGYMELKREGDKEFEAANYFRATELYLEYLAASKDSSIAINLARCYYRYGDAANGLYWYDVVKDKEQELTDQDRLGFIYLFFRAEKLIEIQEMLEQITSNEYAHEKTLILESLEKRQLFFQNEEDYVLDHLNINSDQSDFAFRSFQDGFVMVSNRNVDPAVSGADESNFLNLYYTKQLGEGFSQPEKLTGVFESNRNDGMIALRNSSEAVISRNHFHNNFLGIHLSSNKAIELYTLRLKNGNWKMVEPFPFNDKNYNNTQPTISPDGNTLIYVSDNPIGYGRSDLYMSKYIDGQWSEPQNLGERINTSGRELFPEFIDDSTLVFSSDGHLGVGNLDLFSVNLSSSEPVKNLGVPFNSSGDDFTYHKLDESTFIISSDRNNKAGDDDLIKISYQPKQEQAHVQFTEKKKPTAGQIPIKEFITVIDDNYCQSYELVSMDLVEGCKTPESKFLIQPIYFDFDKTEIKPSAIRHLEDLVNLLNENNNLVVEVLPYTDSFGSEVYNKDLRERRAKAVKNKLIELGVALDQILLLNEDSIAYVPQSKGLSFSKQRRVSYRLIKK